VGQRTGSGIAEAANIMTKHFFVVVPYDGAIISTSQNPISSIRLPWQSAERTSEQVLGAKKAFEENLTQLEQRVAIVQQGLVRTGVRSVQLGTEEVIELLYRIMNPGGDEAPMKTGA
jgi:hypothetical protein